MNVYIVQNEEEKRERVLGAFLRNVRLTRKLHRLAIYYMAPGNLIQLES